MSHFSIWIRHLVSIPQPHNRTTWVLLKGQPRAGPVGGTQWGGVQQGSGELNTWENFTGEGMNLDMQGWCLLKGGVWATPAAGKAAGACPADGLFSQDSPSKALQQKGEGRCWGHHTQHTPTSARVRERCSRTTHGSTQGAGGAHCAETPWSSRGQSHMECVAWHCWLFVIAPGTQEKPIWDKSGEAVAEEGAGRWQ